MKILIFAGMNLNVSSGSPTRARLLCEGLIDAGAEVCVVTLGVPDSFKKIGIQVYIPELNASWTGILQKAASEFQPDWIVGITEAGANFAAQMAKEIGCKLAFDLHSIGVVEILELGKKYGSRPARIKQSISWIKSEYQANVITVANPTLIPIAKLIFQKSHVYPLVGMVDVQRFSPNGQKASFGRFKDKIQVMYIGSLYKWQGVELYLNTIKQIQRFNDDFEFTLIGSVGKEYEADLFQKIKLASNELNYYSSIDYDLVPLYLRGADIVVIPRPFMLSTYFAFPQKLGEFMATGRCIVATNLTPHRWALQNPQCGLLPKPNTGSITKSILKAMDPNVRKNLGELASNKALEQFNHLAQAKRLCNIFRQNL